MTARVRLGIRGLVQGVWFRGAMQEEARRLGVGGWVRNVPDGSVAAEIEGERPDVDALVAWAHQGPPGARVRNVTVEWIPPTGGERGGFAIRR